MIFNIACLLAFSFSTYQQVNDNATFNRKNPFELRGNTTCAMQNEQRDVVLLVDTTFTITFDYYYSTENQINSVKNIDFDLYTSVSSIDYHADTLELEGSVNNTYHIDSLNTDAFLQDLFANCYYNYHVEDNIITSKLIIDNEIINTAQFTSLPSVYGELDNTIQLNIDDDSISRVFNGFGGERVLYQQGYNDGEIAGYQSGYAQGVQDTLEQGSTAQIIFSGIVNVGLLPINVFLGMLNLEVFGINIGALVSAILTIAIVIIVIRLVTGKKND